MYHISIYFDEKTTAHMHRLIEKVAEATGNKYMLEAQVPPHITLCALECGDEEALKERLECAFGGAQMIEGSKGRQETGAEGLLPYKSGALQWVSVGTFLPGVIFLQPVLNEYLQGLMEQVYACVRGSFEPAHEHVEYYFESTPAGAKNLPGVQVKPCYKPFSWLPHSTVAKKLTEEQLRVAFEVLQKEFTVFEGRVVRLGLAKMNPHRELASWELE